ncbi:MAG: hypothetical protein Q7R73_01835 [bacterium]|nr:hypothetical protein [bacterium]
MTVSAMTRREVSWNKMETLPERVENILKAEGITVLEKGVQPNALLKREGKRIVVEARYEQIEDLLKKYQAWIDFYLNGINHIVAVGVGRSYKRHSTLSQ